MDVPSDDENPHVNIDIEALMTRADLPDSTQFLSRQLPSRDIMCMGEKRRYAAMMDSQANSLRASPFLPMFEQFRAELDEHHDRRERIIKASRDITAASKKIIFALQRVRTLNAPIAAGIFKSISPYATIIHNQFQSINADLQSINFYRYYRQISPGIQEYMESLLFQHYLSTQKLLTYEDATKYLRTVATPEKSEDISNTEQKQFQDIPESQRRNDLLTKEDYLLGIFDFTGELMRLAITTMATSSPPPNAAKGDEILPTSQLPRTTLHDLQTLRAYLAVLNYDYKSDGYFAKDADKKLEVTLASVEKVEKALYGMIIRGSERPKGWIPDVREIGGGGAREEVEVY